MNEQQNTNDAKQEAPATTPTAADREPVKTFTQEDVDRIVAERVKREKDTQAKSAEKAAKEAEEKSLKERQEWQTLAERRAAELEAAAKERDTHAASVQTLTERLGATEKALQAVLDNERKGLPKPILGLLDQLDVVAQLEWLAKNKAEVANSKPAGTPLPQSRTTTPASNNGKTPTIGVKF